MIEAQKKEYIEREAALDFNFSITVPQDRRIQVCDAVNNTVKAIATHIEAIPAADVVEVVHAYWIQIDQTKCKCSRCKVITLIAQYPHGDKNYCPNCGAKMDGGNE